MALKIEFTGNNWYDQREKLAQLLKERLKQKNELKRKIKDEAQWIFLKWADENTPAVPHHLISHK